MKHVFLHKQFNLNSFSRFTFIMIRSFIVVVFVFSTRLQFHLS